jgi:hypothetical protein
VRNARQEFSLHLVNQALGPVLEQLADQVSLQLTWSEKLAGREPEPRSVLVSCNVEGVSLPQLLEAVLAPAGFDFELESDSLTILPAE